MPDDDLFSTLRELLARHVGSLVVARDEPGRLELDASAMTPSGTRMQFGSVHAGDGTVRVLLMPVYSHPDLLDGVSDDLRARMRGRTGFEFTPDTASPELTDELAGVIEAAIARYRADKLL